MKELVYENYNTKEATKLLHDLFYGREYADNIGVSRIISHAFYKKPFSLLFDGTGVYAIIDGDSWMIYRGAYTMKFRGIDV